MAYNLDFRREPIYVHFSNSRTAIDFSHRALPSYIATLGTDPKIEQNLAVALY